MDKTRLILALVFAFSSVTIVKLLVMWLENFLKEILKEKSIKVIEMLNNFYFIFCIGASVGLTFLYPVLILKDLKNIDVFILNLLIYTAGILIIYHWLFKPVIDGIVEKLVVFIGNFIQNFKK